MNNNRLPRKNSTSSFEEYCEEETVVEHKLNSLQLTAKDKPAYRYELGGVLIYDSAARIICKGENIEEEKQFFHPSAAPLPNRILLQYFEEYEDSEKVDCKKIEKQKEEYTLVVPEYADGLTFSSHFENGNLKKAVRINATEYSLMISPDFGSKSYSHWFYFQTVSHLKAGTAVSFKMGNFTKGCLYAEGQGVFAYSAKKLQYEKIGWHSSCFNVQSNQWPSVEQPPDSTFEALRFSYTYE